MPNNYTIPTIPKGNVDTVSCLLGDLIKDRLARPGLVLELHQHRHRRLGPHR